MIDDVWSGGSREDGEYPLMSEAVAAGLYHPRCKYAHSTYFEGISRGPGNGYTQEELEDLQEQSSQEARQQYAERQVEKYGRLAEYSLDSGNAERYSDRRDEWENIIKQVNVQNLDYMGKTKILSNNMFKVKAYEVDGKEKILTQTYSKDAKNTIEFLAKMIDEGLVRNVENIVVVKDLPGIASYDHIDSIMYVNEKLSNELFISKKLSSSYFVAENAEDVIKHEMFHKKHWDYVMTKGENYVMIKYEIESELHKYVAEQQIYDISYISKVVSENASFSYKYKNSLNELIAEVLLQEEKGIVKDETLLKLVRRCVE